MGDLFGYRPTGTTDPTGGGGAQPPIINQPTPTSGTPTTEAPVPSAGGPDSPLAPPVVTEGAVEEAAPTFAGSAGGGGLSLEEDEDKRKRIKRRTLGTQQLQIPLTSTGVSTGASVNTGLNI